MISIYDALKTIDIGRYYLILNEKNIKNYNNFKFMPDNFSYRSNENKNFLKISDLEKIIKPFLQNYRVNKNFYKF